MYEGGFGVIHRAKSKEGARAVAKFIPKSPGAERELLFENLEGLPNVVPILDRGEWGDMWVLIMPEADKSLSDFIEKPGRLVKIDEAIRILCDVAIALEAIEGRVVHRDIKPSNILFLNEVWCLADFGISRYAEASTATDTRKHALTPAYAAPEQWRRERATGATDVYAFGVVAYELLSGRRPFEGPSTEDFRLQHLHHHPEPIKDIPDNLGSLIDECLYKAVGTRPIAKVIMQRLQDVTRPVSEAANKLQRVNAAVVRQQAEDRRQESIARSDAESRRQKSEVASIALDKIVHLLQREFEVNASSASYDGAWSWSLNDATLSVDLMENTGPPTQGRNLKLPFDVVSYSKITIDKPRDRHGYEGRSHSLWFCDAQEAGVFRWYETAFMYNLAIPKFTSHKPFALEPGDSSRQAISIGMNYFQVVWPFIPIDQGNEREFIEQWIGWFADAAAGILYSPTRMPEKEPEGAWRRS